jgi:hypothetical protein
LRPVFLSYFFSFFVFLTYFPPSYLYPHSSIWARNVFKSSYVPSAKRDISCSFTTFTELQFLLSLCILRL